MEPSLFPFFFFLLLLRKEKKRADRVLWRPLLLLFFSLLFRRPPLSPLLLSRRSGEKRDFSLKSGLENDLSPFFPFPFLSLSDRGIALSLPSPRILGESQRAPPMVGLGPLFFFLFSLLVAHQANGPCPLLFFSGPTGARGLSPSLILLFFFSSAAPNVRLPPFLRRPQSRPTPPSEDGFLFPFPFLR